MPTDTVAVVTGASRGIGKSAALALAQEGYRTVLVARSEDALKAVADEIRVSGGKAPLIMPTDIADPDAIRQTVTATMDACGRVDLLFNNAGMFARGTLDLPLETYAQLLAVNLIGPLLFMQLIVPVMLKQGNGYIINLASRSGKIGFAGIGAYTASKFGMVGLGETVYRELAKKEIKVTTICPSYVNTDMTRLGGIPLPPHEMIQPDDIAETIRWLLRLSPAACVREVVIECRTEIV